MTAAAQEAGRSEGPSGFLVLPLLAAAVVTFHPVWRWYIERMHDGSDEPLGVLPLLTACVLLLRRAGSPFAVLRARRTVFELILPCIFAGCYSAACWYGMPPLVRAAFAVTTVGTLVAPIRRRMPPPIGFWGLLLLSLPIVASLQFFLGYPARWVTARLARIVLGICGIDARVEGVLVEWQGKLLLIDAPCSGVKLLWTVSFAGFALLAFHGLSGRRAWIQLATGSLLVLAGNVVRTALVFLFEMEIVKAPASAHQAVGALIAGGVVMLLAMLGSFLAHYERRSTSADVLSAAAPASNVLACLFILLLVPALIMPPPAFRNAPPGARPLLDADRARISESASLVEVSLTDDEARALAGFPGRAYRFRDDSREYFVRIVDRPTRTLHPAADCFRASGYRVEPSHAFKDDAGRVHNCSRVESKGREQRVCERIEELNGSRSFGDVSSWFWNALFGKTEGPWIAVSAIESL